MISIFCLVLGLTNYQPAFEIAEYSRTTTELQLVKKRGRKKNKKRSKPSVAPYAVGAILLFNGREYWCENGAKPFVYRGKVYCPVN